MILLLMEIMQKLRSILLQKKIAPYVEDLNLLKLGRMKHQGVHREDGMLLSLVDWSKLREQIIMALPSDYKDEVLSREIQCYDIGEGNPEAVNLFGILETCTTTPYLIPESSYNGILEAIGKNP